MIGWLLRSGMIAAVSLRLLYLIFQQVLRLVLLLGRTASSKDVELLVLRHETDRPASSPGVNLRARGARAIVHDAPTIDWMVIEPAARPVAVADVVGNVPTRTPCPSFAGRRWQTAGMLETVPPVRIERDGDVAVVVLDRPPLNLFDSDTFAALEHVVAELGVLTDPVRADRVRAVLVEARGKVVSGGVDVTMFSTIAEGPDAVASGGQLWAHLLRIAQTLEDLPVPTVFAAHALTLTAAFELALACDVLLSESDQWATNTPLACSHTPS